MNNHCITLFEIVGNPDSIQKIEDEYFTHQTWKTWAKTVQLWGLDFDKVLPTPNSLMLEFSMFSEYEGGWDYSATTMLSELLYPTRKTRPTVKKAMGALLLMPDLLPSEFAPPKNLHHVMALLRQTWIGRRLLFLNHLHYRNRKRYGENGLQKWRKDHWGSSVLCEYFEVLDKGRYLLHTSWNPPLLVFKALSRQFPEIRIHVRYMDMQVLIAGIETWHKGVLIEGGSVDAKNFVIQRFLGVDLLPI